MKLLTDNQLKSEIKNSTADFLGLPNTDVKVSLVRGVFFNVTLKDKENALTVKKLWDKLEGKVSLEKNDVFEQIDTTGMTREERRTARRNRKVVDVNYTVYRWL